MPDSSFDVDVVIPLRNGEQWILETLASVAAQTLAPRQVLVVDDGSTDRSRFRAGRIPGVTLIENHSPGSAVAARNCGLDRASAEFVAFLDQDDLWHPEHLRLLVGLLQSDREAQAASARPLHFRDGERAQFDLTNAAHRRYNPWDTFPFSEGHDPSLIVCRRRLFDLFRWPQDHIGMADISLWLRIAMEGPVIRTAAATVARRWHTESMYSVQRRKDPGALLRMYRKVADERFNEFCHRNPEDPRIGDLARRRQIVHSMSVIVDSLIEQSVEQLRTHFKALDALLEPERDEAFRRRPFKHLIPVFATMTELGDTALPATRIHELLLEGCTSQSPISRQEIRDWVIRMMPGFGVSARHYLRSPLSPDRIRFAATVISRRLARTTGDQPSRPGSAAAPVEYVSCWGQAGRSDGCFLHLEDLAIDGQGRLLATDAYRSVVQVFSRDGEYLGAFGELGGGDGQFDEPEGIAVSPRGDVFVSDSEAGDIQVFDSRHRFRFRFGGRGSGPGQSRHSEFMGFGTDGLLYLADGLNDRICVFDSAGRFIRSFGGTGEARGQLRFPQACKLDSEGRVWVTDLQNHRVQAFAPTGEPLLCFGRKGSGPGEFHSPTGIAIGPDGNVWVCDRHNHRIQSFDANGSFRFQFGRPGSGPGELSDMLGILVDHDNNIFVCDTGNNRIQKFRVKPS